MENKTLIVDFRIYKESVETLEKLGYSIIKLSSQARFDGPVCAHPDMFITKIVNKVFCDSVIYDILPTSVYIYPLPRTNVLFRYPYDIEFNCAYVGKYLICNKKYTHPEILKCAGNNGIEIIDTNQGYAKCSICVVSDCALITEDNDIYNKCTNKGLDVLLIEKGFVKLNGYNYGFIGGCSGLVDNKLLFNGNIKNHPEYNRICEFCRKHNVDIIQLCDKELYDIGSIVEL